jgi:GTP-binding protein HflX
MNKPRQALHSTAAPEERAYLVAVERKDRRSGLCADDSLDELELLAHTAGAEVAGRAVQRLDSPNPALYIG